jgi:hypothetical protein
VGAAPYERNDDRKGYRNGSYPRSLKTRVGQIELQVPRDRDGRFCPTLFKAYERHEQALQLAPMEMVLHGVSTRKVTDVVEALCGHSLSKSAVSAMTADLMDGVNEWLERPLPEGFVCIMLDATYVKVRENGRVVSRAVLIAVGIRSSGEREVLGVQVSDKESHAYWGDFIQSLASRGLKSVAWVVSDQHEGLVQAIQTHLQGSTWQRCQVHFARNFLARLPKQEQAKWICRLRDVMNRLSRKIADRPVLALIRKFLQCGIMSGIELSDRIEGTPQGGPLSPLLANVLLDEVDKELERRGHRFVRYADDCNIYVRSQRAGERVLESMTRLYSRLRLKVNAQKTAVGPTYGRKFLGFCFRRWAKGSSKISIAPKAIQAFRDRIRQITSRSKGRSLPSIVEALKQYVPGWKAYFRLAKVSQIYKDLDSWIRHRLRALIFKQWKRGPTIYSRVRAMGYGHDIARKAASHGSSWWRGSTGYFNIVLPDRYFDAIGVPRVA